MFPTLMRIERVAGKVERLTEYCQRPDRAVSLPDSWSSTSAQRAVCRGVIHGEHFWR